MLQILKNPKNLGFFRSTIGIAYCRFSSGPKDTHSHDSHGGALHDEHEDHDDHHDDHHGHHAKEYDWRDDPKYNKDLYRDVRDIGWDPTTYTYPYQGREEFSSPFPSKNINLDDVTLNIRPENRKYHVDATGLMRATYWNPDGDFAHEADYESEDLDFQAEDFKTQHFKKKGPIWPYFIAGNLFLVYFWMEFMYQHYPDEDYFRIPRPPPLDYPDADDTDDSESYKDEFSKDGRYLRETGIVTDIWYDIVDGKKVIRRFAGANQPMPNI